MSDIAAAEQTVTKEELVQRARSLVPGIRERAAAAEEGRRLPQESVDELLDAGLARALVPRRFGGFELGIDAWFEVVRELGKADASHAWCGGLLISFGHWVAFFPPEAQEAVWADGPDVPIAGSIPPVCKATLVDGGYRVSGQAPFASGVLHASWVMIAAMLHGEGPPEWCFFLVPPDEYEVADTWHTVAMRATGSNTIVVDDVFVPETHMLRLADFREGRGPGRAASGSALYRLPWLSYAPTTFIGTMIGAVQGSYEQFRDWTRTRATRSGPAVDLATVHVSMARLAADADAAELLVARAIEQTQGPEPPTLETRTRSMRDFGRASELSVGAIDSLLTMSGTAGFSESNALQRAWRDVHFCASHASLNPLISGPTWARAELGLERPATQLLY